ncbi:MAG: hypothetical protein ACRELA_24525 [Candidatus Rokuibacteriota bacterium]
MDPVSETAHYITAGRDSEADLLLVQHGRLERPGLINVVWDRPGGRSRDLTRRGRPGTTRGRARQMLRRALDLFSVPA